MFIYASVLFTKLHDNTIQEGSGPNLLPINNGRIRSITIMNRCKKSQRPLSSIIFNFIFHAANTVQTISHDDTKHRMHARTM